MGVEQMFAHLLNEMKANQEKMDANQERMKQQIGSLASEIKADKEETEAYM
jgi:hypothetical protein